MKLVQLGNETNLCQRIDKLEEKVREQQKMLDLLYSIVVNGKAVPWAPNEDL